jgi:hypothetical protein
MSQNTICHATFSQVLLIKKKTLLGTSNKLFIHQHQVTLEHHKGQAGVCNEKHIEQSRYGNNML